MEYITKVENVKYCWHKIDPDTGKHWYLYDYTTTPENCSQALSLTLYSDTKEHAVLLRNHILTYPTVVCDEVHTNLVEYIKAEYEKDYEKFAERLHERTNKIQGLLQELKQLGVILTVENIQTMEKASPHWFRKEFIYYMFVKFEKDSPLTDEFLCRGMIDLNVL